jgi:hypothetical protein
MNGSQVSNILNSFNRGHQAPQQLQQQQQQQAAFQRASPYGVMQQQPQQQQQYGVDPAAMAMDGGGDYIPLEASGLPATAAPPPPASLSSGAGGSGWGSIILFNYTLEQWKHLLIKPLMVLLIIFLVFNPYTAEFLNGIVPSLFTVGDDVTMMQMQMRTLIVGGLAVGCLAMTGLIAPPTN